MHIATHLSKRRWTKPPARRTPAEKRTPDVTYTCLARSFITTASHAPRMDTAVNTPIERPFHPSTVIAILVFYMLLNCRKEVDVEVLACAVTVSHAFFCLNCLYFHFGVGTSTKWQLSSKDRCTPDVRKNIYPAHLARLWRADVPPVAVWSMAAIGWGLRGGISRQIRFCCLCLVEWKFY